MARHVFSVGECPVCPGFGPVLALALEGRADLVFFCPACEGAWVTPPGKNLDEVNRLEELAPGGVRLPTDAEVSHLRTATRVDAAPWGSRADRAAGALEAFAIRSPVTCRFGGRRCTSRESHRGVPLGRRRAAERPTVTSCRASRHGSAARRARSFRAAGKDVAKSSDQKGAIDSLLQKPRRGRWWSSRAVAVSDPERSAADRRRGRWPRSGRRGRGDRRYDQRSAHPGQQPGRGLGRNGRRTSDQARRGPRAVDRTAG